MCQQGLIERLLVLMKKACTSIVYWHEVCHSSLYRFSFSLTSSTIKFQTCIYTSMSQYTCAFLKELLGSGQPSNFLKLSSFYVLKVFLRSQSIFGVFENFPLDQKKSSQFSDSYIKHFLIIFEDRPSFRRWRVSCL